MGGGAEDERHTRVDPNLEPILVHRRHELTSLPIPDDLTLDILRRLPNPADLVRASAACVSFRRLIADRSFLRRFRELHAPPLLGFLEQDTKVFHPVASPHPSAPEARAAALAADFSFSFLPAPFAADFSFSLLPAPARDWLVQDTRDGRVLLDRPREHGHGILNRYKVVFPELVVCDPLHRRYILLPPIPAHLATTVERPLQSTQHRYCETFLAPPADASPLSSAAEQTTSFSVIWMAHCATKPVAFVFSSSTGQWRPVSSPSWSASIADLLSLTQMPPFSGRQYAYGCFYWLKRLGGQLLELDTRRMEVSISELPREIECLRGEDIAIVEAGEGRPGMYVRLQFTNHLNYYVRGNNGGWQFEKTVSLDFECLFIGSMGRHLFLSKRASSSLDAGLLSLDVKTFHLERLFVSNSFITSGRRICTYSNFPPSLLSTPTI
ncbi:uncharacterized protein [Lolium perenne]|uniref:uncharacterized protein isoform X1 n=1 Tax=Lolium perenne TaxID=4522 RepID=UPI0021EB2D34|nr:uncharacterized protein LOC127308065 isoform X1 [Lolium perenne]XP_051194790.1 uncharacterized protein LOC127308065 isoform X1 [Lolium perenne]